MNKDWTIDTKILYMVEDDFRAINFLDNVRLRKHIVVLDFEGRIVREYRSCFNSVSYAMRKALNKWFSAIRIRYFSNCLDSKCRTKLTKLKFHQDDWPFIGICIKSNNKKLVAEESDYTDEVKEYLEGDLEINILSLQGALEDILEI